MEKFIKNYVGWLLTHAPALIMIILLVINPKNWKALTTYSGYFSVGFFVLILSLNPLKTLFPKLLIVTKLNRYRQEIGVASFSYALIHLVCFVIKRGGINETIPYLFLHPAIIVGFWIAFVVMFLLAITSNKWSMRTFTFAKWKKLHKKVYLAEIAVFAHMIILKQAKWAFIIFTPLLLLQLGRYYVQQKG